MQHQERKRTALLIAAHGDRGAGMTNGNVKAHVGALRALNRFGGVACGFLKGEPLVEEALRALDAGGFDEILIYPLFMSDGYFTNTALPQRIDKAACRTPARVLTPLGLDLRLPDLCETQALRTVLEAGLAPQDCQLLIVGHGSTQSAASKNATEHFADRVAKHSAFATIATCYLEEPPFLKEALLAADRPIIISGFFAGEGMHGGEDVPALIRETGANARYTGAIGAHPRISDLILDSALSQPAPV